MHSLSPSLSATPAVLTVELPMQWVQEGGRPPAPLSPAEADRLAGAVADDLQRILGELSDYGLVLLGALYDMTELLRPGLPMIDALMELYRGSLPDGQFLPQLMALGGQGERFPIPAIAPRRAPGSGPLLAIPFLLLGEAEAVDELETRMEKALLEKGRAGVATEQAIKEQFGIQPENLAYATFNDLCALLKLQLEHAEFGPLWEVLEGALFRPQDSGRTETPEGNLFLRQQDQVHTPFFSVDQWLARDGADLESYAHWLRRQRQYLAGLAAHGLRLVLIRPEGAVWEHCADGSVARSSPWGTQDDLYLVDPVTGAERTPETALADADLVLLTEHSLGVLGPVAYTVMIQNQAGELAYLAHEYPVSPAGIQTIRQRWEQLAEKAGAQYQLLQPGRVVVDEAGRLVPALED